MSKQSSHKDNNHDTIKRRAEQRAFQIIDTYHVGNDFPDQIWTIELAVTVIGTFNQLELENALLDVEGIDAIHPGGVFLIEVKNPESGYDLSDGQRRFILKHPMTKVIKTDDDVDRLRGMSGKENTG